jgi:hypothetical protein
LFVQSLWGSLPLPLSLESSRCPTLFSMCPFQFLVFILFFFWAVVRLSRGLHWFIPVVAVRIPCATYLLTCWSVSPMQVRIWCLAAQEPSLFLCITWHGEVMCAGGPVVSEFCFVLVVFPARCVSSISARFLLYGSHTICFLFLVAILETPLMSHLYVDIYWHFFSANTYKWNGRCVLNYLINGRSIF